MTRRLAFVLQIDLGVFALHAQDNGWQQIDVGQDEPFDEDRPDQRWRVPGGEVRLVDDTVILVQYVDVTAEPTGPIEEAIKSEFTCYDREDCLEVLDFGQAEEAVCHAVRLLTCTAPGPFDQRVFDAAVAAMHDRREDVRVAAMMIANYTGWAQFLPEISRLATNDPSDRVRGFADSHRFILELALRTATGG